MGPYRDTGPDTPSRGFANGSSSRLEAVTCSQQAAFKDSFVPSNRDPQHKQCPGLALRNLRRDYTREEFLRGGKVPCRHQ